MQKASGLIALLLIAAVLLMPLSPEKRLATETPLIFGGVSTPQSEPATQENKTDDTATIIAIVVVVIIVIFIIHYIADAENQNAVRR